MHSIIYYIAHVDKVITKLTQLNKVAQYCEFVLHVLVKRYCLLKVKVTVYIIVRVSNGGSNGVTESDCGGKEGFSVAFTVTGTGHLADVGYG